MYNSKVPNALNYGGAGFVSGHELSHGLDFWIKTSDESDRKNSHYKCIIEQLKEVVEPQTKEQYPSGEGLITEGLADVGGINASLTAYRKHAEQEDTDLEGVKLTTDQLFFVSEANSWCYNADDETIKSQLSSAYGHPFPYHRVIVPALNSPDFAKAFNCKPGSRMNPVNKCTMW